MAVVENRSTEIGDVILIKSEIPIVGLIALNGFTDITTNETGTRFFNKQFRYSTDGVNFNPEGWLDLTTANLQAVQVEATDIFVVEYRYERAGTDATGEIAFDEVRLQGEYTPEVIGYVFENSLFGQFLTPLNLDVLGWALNVLEKVFQRGILPSYVERRNTDNPQDDKEFADFWVTVTSFFAYIVIFGRQFQSFSSNETLLREFISQKDLHFCNSTSLEDLTTLINNYFNEIAKRGTFNIAIAKDDGAIVDGELLRLLCKITCDELIFALQKPHHVGWNIGNSSPLSPDVNDQKYNNKSWTDQANIDDLTPFPLVNSGIVSLQTDGSRDGILVGATSPNLIGGIGVDPDNFDLGSFDLSKAIIVSANLDYQITFQIKQPTEVLPTITFGLLPLDSDGNVTILDNIITGANSNYFFRQQSLNIVNKWYYVQGVVFNKDKGLLSAQDGRLNIGYGNHLRFSDENICRVIPFILVETDGGFSGNGSILLYDIKMRPLQTQYTTGFINISNFIHVWQINRNQRYSQSQIDQIIRKKFIPYNTLFKAQYLPAVDFGAIETQFSLYLISKQNVSTNGGSDGSIFIGVVGGTTPITYSWNSGQTTKDILNIPAGVYTITATDDDSNVAQISNIQITEPGIPPTIVLVALVQPTVAGNDGSIEIRIDDGNAPFTVEWDAGQIDVLVDNVQTSLLENLAPGIYPVTVTDDDGITDVAAFELVSPAFTHWILKDKQLLYTDLTDPWQAATIANLTPFSYIFLEMALNGDKGIATMDSGLTYITSDSGANWDLEGGSARFPGSNIVVTRIDDRFIAVHNQYVYKNVISNWPTRIDYTLPSNPKANDIHSTPNGSVALLVGDSTWRSTNKGDSWTSFGLYSPVVGSQPKAYSAFMVNDDVGYIGCVNAVFRTLDGGNSWEDIMRKVEIIGGLPVVVPYEFPEADYIYSFDTYFKGYVGGVPQYDTYAVGLLKKLYKTTTGNGPNEGDGWVEIPTTGIPTTSAFLKVAVLDENTLWILTGTQIYQSTDGGSNWSLYAATGLTNSSIDDFYIKSKNK